MSTRPLTCPKCGARASIAEDVTGYLDWGPGEINDDGTVRPADPDHTPPVLMADNAEVTGRLRGCCNNTTCGHQWRIRRRLARTLPDQRSTR